MMENHEEEIEITARCITSPARAEDVIEWFNEVMMGLQVDNFFIVVEEVKY